MDANQDATNDEPVLPEADQMQEGPEDKMHGAEMCNVIHAADGVLRGQEGDMVTIPVSGRIMSENGINVLVVEKAGGQPVVNPEDYINEEESDSEDSQEPNEDAGIGDLRDKLKNSIRENQPY